MPVWGQHYACVLVGYTSDSHGNFAEQTDSVETWDFRYLEQGKSLLENYRMSRSVPCWYYFATLLIQ